MAAHTSLCHVLDVHSIAATRYERIATKELFGVLFGVLLWGCEVGRRSWSLSEKGGLVGLRPAKDRILVGMLAVGCPLEGASIPTKMQIRGGRGGPTSPTEAFQTAS